MSHHTPFIFFLAKDLKREDVTTVLEYFCVFCAKVDHLRAGLVTNQYNCMVVSMAVCQIKLCAAFSLPSFLSAISLFASMFSSIRLKSILTVSLL